MVLYIYISYYKICKDRYLLTAVRATECPHADCVPRIHLLYGPLRASGAWLYFRASHTTKAPAVVARMVLRLFRLVKLGRVAPGLKRRRSFPKFDMVLFHKIGTKTSLHFLSLDQLPSAVKAFLAQVSSWWYARGSKYVATGSQI